MTDQTQQALYRALYKLLRPMVRLLMRHGVSYRLFADVARHVYVDVAEQDFALPGRKPSNARVAVLTGINRKDIAKLKERPHPLAEGTIDNPNPCSRIITAWINNPRYHDQQGQPIDLVIDENPSEPNFTELVSDHSSDVPVRAVLDELERMGAVIRIEDRVRLVVQAYVPHADLAENIRIFGTAAADLMGTMDHNIAKLGPTFIQRTVSYDDIPVELLDRIRQRSRADSEAFLLQVNEWLAGCDREQTPSLIGSGRIRAGVGVYYFEQLAGDPSQEEQQ